LSRHIEVQWLAFITNNEDAPLCEQVVGQECESCGEGGGEGMAL